MAKKELIRDGNGNLLETGLYFWNNPSDKAGTFCYVMVNMPGKPVYIEDSEWGNMELTGDLQAFAKNIYKLGGNITRTRMNIRFALSKLER